MKALMVGHALRFAERIIFFVGETNLRSRRAQEKIGAVLTPRVKIATLGGREVRHVVYAIDRAGFVAGPLADGGAAR